MSSNWRYLATRLNGDGTETFLSYDVPLQRAEITEDLSGPGGIDGTVAPELERLKAKDGTPIFRPWHTAIYAEKDNTIYGAGILADMPIDGPNMRLDCIGFSGYLNGQPYRGDRSEIGVDPLVMARHLWDHQQAVRGGNLGLILDPATSPRKIGTKERDVKFETKAGEDVEFTAGPYLLNWWQTHDMGREFDNLADTTPFDYRVEHAWDGERIVHRMRIGYPVLGRRRSDLRFMVGENVRVVPQIDYFGDDYADEVVVLGAGEGRKMIRDSAVRPNAGRLRRTVVVQDKTLTSKSAAKAMAQRELAYRLGDADISEIEIPLGSVQVGDEIFVQTPRGWANRLNLWVRVLSIKTSPSKNSSVLSVSRVEKTD